MGMTGYLQSISAAQLSEIIDNPDHVENVLWPDEPGEPRVDLDKAWHGLHFLLTGEAYGGSGPLALAIMGGTPIGGDLGTGPAVYLTGDEVKTVAEALSVTSEASLRDRFDPSALISNDIYPGPWTDGDFELDYLVQSYPQVVSYYTSAASRGDGMLFFIS